ncbi:response regulator transcription factor [Alloactinosynnema sp. L-07]|uniref:response regulator transcription factor n=1 Tax=Alloactinosynnema sp. L-07 TaxID=1653480 RepID=UPI0012FBFD23|nr:response regulator transcription factor [Alloactinosynnema sp. L-07]
MTRFTLDGNIPDQSLGGAVTMRVERLRVAVAFRREADRLAVESALARDMRIVARADCASTLTATLAQVAAHVLVADCDLGLACGATPPMVVALWSTERSDTRLAQFIQSKGEGVAFLDGDSGELSRAVNAVAAGGVWVTPNLGGELLTIARSNPRPRERAVPALTDRETSVLGLLVDGHTDVEIARMLHLGVRTVKHHTANLRHKFAARNRSHLAALSMRSGGHVRATVAG